MEQNLTFDQLPLAVTMLTKEVSELKTLLLDKREQPINQPEHFLSVQEAAKFLNLAVSTIYSKVSRNELPVMKRGKRLFFSKNSLTEWIKGGLKKSNSELEREAEIFTNSYRSDLTSSHQNN